MKIKMALYGVLLLSALPVFSQNKLMEKTAPLLFSTSSPYDSFGVLMRTNSGTIINFYREGTDHTTAGVGVIRTSTNNGSSWSYYSGTRYGSAGSCANSGVLLRGQFANRSAKCEWRLQPDDRNLRAVYWIMEWFEHLHNLLLALHGRHWRCVVHSDPAVWLFCADE